MMSFQVEKAIKDLNTVIRFFGLQMVPQAYFITHRVSCYLASCHSLTCDSLLLSNFVVVCTSHVRIDLYLFTWMYAYGIMN